MLKDEKKELRKKLLQKRAELTHEYILNASEEMFSKIVQLECYRNAKTVMVYVSYNNEVFTHNFIKQMIAEGKQVVTPTCNSDHSMTLCVTKRFPEGFKKTKMGILEIPANEAEAVSPEELDIIITPGLAFTLEGKRLGYGGGYYDRLFEKIRADCLKLCPSFDSFLIDDIPTGYHDEIVDIIVTECKTVFIKG